MIRNTSLLRNSAARASATHLRHTQVRHLSYIKPSASGWDQLEKFAKDVQNNVKEISMDDQIDRRTTDAVKTLGIINKKLAELDGDSTT